VAFLPWGLVACSVGSGRGRIDGTVRDVACGIEVPDYHMSPDFFAADVVEDRGAPDGRTSRGLLLRIQRGSYRESDSDGMVIYVRDVNDLVERGLGVPVPFDSGPDAPVEATLYLNQTCDAGFPDEFWTIPTILEAQSGTITFDALYAPDLDPNGTDISAHLDAVFQDPAHPEGRVARLEGEFSFYYQRGRPGQVFP